MTSRFICQLVVMTCTSVEEVKSINCFPESVMCVTSRRDELFCAVKSVCKGDYLFCFLVNVETAESGL